MAAIPLPRPRNLSEVCDYLEALANKFDDRTKKLAEGISQSNTDIGRLAAEVAGLRRDIRSVRAGRDPDSSYHDFDAELAEYRRILKDREGNPEDPAFTPNTAKSMVRKAISEVARDDKAQNWDRAKKIAIRIAIGILLIIAGSVLHKLGLQLPPP